MQFPSWENAPLALLVDCYLAGFSEECLFPTAITLPWDPCPRPQAVVYTNVTFLSELVRRLGVAGKFFRAPIAVFSRFIAHDAMIQFRSLLHGAASYEDAVTIGMNSRYLILRAMKEMR